MLAVWRGLPRHVGSDAIVADANQVFFVAGGEGYRMSRPIEGGYASSSLPCCRRYWRSSWASASGRSPRTRCFAALSPGGRAAAVARCARFARQPARRMGRAGERGVWWSSSGLACRTHGRAGGEPISHPFADARKIPDGESGVACSSVARGDGGAHVARLPDHALQRLEGVSLHQYSVQLRLARSLVDLPHASDITRLASHLGFSTHSHFTSSFRRAFGCTPSAYRD